MRALLVLGASRCVISQKFLQEIITSNMTLRIPATPQYFSLNFWT